MEENKEINKENIKIFKRYGIRDSSVKRYKCVLCERDISIDSSASNEGDRLICMDCYFTKFNSKWSFDARKWINRED